MPNKQARKQGNAAEAGTSFSPAELALPAAPPFGLKVLFAAGAGAGLAACFPSIGMSVCLPLCMAIFLWLLRGVTRRQAFYLGFTFGLVSFCAGLYWFSRLFGMAVVSLCALLAVFPTLFAVVYVWLRERLPRFPGWLLAPLLWTGIEYYRSELFALNFGWMGLGYGVVNTPLLAACASWFGCYGLTFGIVLFGALLANAFTANSPFPEEKRATRRGQASISPSPSAMKRICFATMRSFERTARRGVGVRFGRPAFLYCLWLLLFCFSAPPAIPEHPLHVRLVQANSEDEDHFYSLSRYDAAQSVPKPDVIVWPEYSFVRDPKLEPKLWKQLQRVAQEQSAFLLFGAKDQFDRDDQNHYRNTAFLLDPSGREVGRHVKNHPVHFIRDGVAGTDASAIPTTLGRLGVGICFDMDYPDVARRLASDGAEAFLIPNEDPPDWGPAQQAQHRLMFQMRAAECGKWLARADVAGGTSAAAPNGQEVARVNTTNAARLDVTIGRNQDKTVFTRGGWRFGQLCLLVSVALCIYALMQTKMRKDQEARP